MKTLREVLKENMGRNVKIGAKGGSGFLYCGMISPGLFPWLDNQSNKVYVANLNKIDKTMDDLGSYKDVFFPEYWSHRQAVRLNKGYSPLNNDEKAYAFKTMHRNLEKRLEKLETERDNFTSLLDCEVYDCYRSVLPEERGTVIVIFKGATSYLDSRYWTVKECNCNHNIRFQIDLLDHTAKGVI